MRTLNKSVFVTHNYWKSYTLETRGQKGMAIFQVSCTNEGEEYNEVYKEAHVYSLTPQVNYCCKVDFMTYGANSFFSLPISPSKGSAL